MEEFTAEKASMAMSLPWEWIVEKLIDNKEIGTPLLKAMIMHIPDMENASCCNLQERIALRYLEEILFVGKFEEHAISLLKVFAKSSLSNSNAVEDLLLRVCTEVVLGHIREADVSEERDWEGFETDLKRVFTDLNLSASFTGRRNELLGLLKDKSDYLTTLEKYPVEILKIDLLCFVREIKARLNTTVLDQLVCDITDGHYSCTPFLHYKCVSPTGEECSNGRGRKRIYREATKECEHRSSEGQKRLKHGVSASSPHVEKIKECMMARYNVSDDCFRKNKDLDSRTVNLNRDAQKSTNDSPDIGCGQEVHCNRDKEILQVSSGTKSISNGHPHCDKSTDNDIHGLEGQVTSHDDTRNLDAEGTKEGHLHKVEDLPELDHLLLDNNCPGQSCFKCRKAGTLSHCNGCSIAVHDKCLQSYISTSSGEIVNCPVCSYKRALEAYKTAKKEALESKRRLLAFIDMKAAQDNREKVWDRGKSEKEIFSDTGNSVKDFSSHVHAFILGSKRNQLPLHTRSSETSAHEIETPNGIDNGQQFMQIDAHDGDHELSHDEDRKYSLHDRKSHGDFELSHDEDRKYNLRKRKPSMRGTSFRLPGARKNKLPWTKAEEAILKEGLQNFLPTESDTIPWTKILQYGKGIFHKSRVGGDLKDKWRNMGKGSS